MFFLLPKSIETKTSSYFSFLGHGTIVHFVPFALSTSTTTLLVFFLLIPINCATLALNIATGRTFDSTCRFGNDVCLSFAFSVCVLFRFVLYCFWHT